MKLELPDMLSGAQRAAAEQALGEESARRRHLVVALSGGHAYGFPSPDSDLDLKGFHAAPARGFLGLAAPPVAANRLDFVGGVEVDYTSNEIGAGLAGILGGNGNYLERVLGHLLILTTPWLEELAALARGALSRRYLRHYRGFAGQQMREVRDSDAPTAKRVLYVLRTTLTGAHLLRAGELRVDVTTVMHEYGFGAAQELVDIKRAGEKTPLPAAVAQRWIAELGRAFELLERAHDESPLPAEPANGDALDDWLVRFRRDELAAGPGQAP